MKVGNGFVGMVKTTIVAKYFKDSCFPLELKR